MKSREDYRFLESQYQDVLQQAMKHKAQLAAAVAEQERRAHRGAEAGTSCQIITVRDI